MEKSEPLLVFEKFSEASIRHAKILDALRADELGQATFPDQHVRDAHRAAAEILDSKIQAFTAEPEVLIQGALETGETLDQAVTSLESLTDVLGPDNVAERTAVYRPKAQFLTNFLLNHLEIDDPRLERITSLAAKIGAISFEGLVAFERTPQAGTETEKVELSSEHKQGELAVIEAELSPAARVVEHVKSLPPGATLELTPSELWRTATGENYDVNTQRKDFRRLIADLQHAGMLISHNGVAGKGSRYTLEYFAPPQPETQKNEGSPEPLAPMPVEVSLDFRTAHDVSSVAQTDAVEAPQQDASEKSLNKYLDPATSLLFATFLTRVREELVHLGHEPLNSEYVNYLLETYPDVLVNADPLQQRTQALDRIGEMLMNPELVERVFYELVDSERDPREELFLYLTNLYHRDPNSMHDTLSRLLKKERSMLIQIYNPKRSGPLVRKVEVIPRIEPIPTNSEQESSVDYTLESADAALLATFLHTMRSELEQQGISGINVEAVKRILAMPDAQEENWPTLERRERLAFHTEWATDANTILQVVSHLEVDDPRVQLLTYLYEVVTNAEAATTIQFLREQARTQVTLQEPIVQSALSAPPAAKKEKPKRPALELMCRSKIGDMLASLEHLDLRGSYPSAVYIQVLGKRAKNAIGAGKEHGDLTIEAGRVSVADMIFAMLRADGNPTIVEFANRKAKELRKIINSGIDKIKEKK